MPTKPPKLTMSELLSSAAKALQDQLTAQIHAAGFPDYNTADGATLLKIPASGARACVLAQQAQVSKQAMSKLLQSLERRGWVEREQDPKDQRAQRVRLTSEGERLVRCLKRADKALDGQLGQHLGPEELEVMRKQVSKLLLRLEPHA